MTPKIYLDESQDIDITTYINILNDLAQKILFDKKYLASAHPFL